MKKTLLLSLLLLGFLSCVKGQHVANVRYHITDSAVVIHYDLNIVADVSVHVSSDNGKTYSKELSFLEGAVGKKINPGHSLEIVWPISSTEIPEKLLFKVEAKPCKNNTDQPIKSQLNKKTFRPYACVIGGINCDFSSRFKWEGIGGWVGYMKRVGFYFNFLTNWWPNRSDIPLLDLDTPLDSYTKNKLRRSYDLGLLIRTCEPLTIKIGCGYGKYKEFVLMEYPYNMFSYTPPEWLYDPRTSIQGFELNLGLLFHMNWFNLSLEATAINFKHYDIRLGFGFGIDI